MADMISGKKVEQVIQEVNSNKPDDVNIALMNKAYDRFKSEGLKLKAGSPERNAYFSCEANFDTVYNSYPNDCSALRLLEKGIKHAAEAFPICDKDKVCDADDGETVDNCSSDCQPPPPVCDKDNVCDPGENITNCYEDCYEPPEPVCGDGMCDPGETKANCSDDCGEPEDKPEGGWEFHFIGGALFPTGYTAPSANGEQKSTSWPVAPQVGVDIGGRAKNGLGLFLHADIAFIRVDTPKAASESEDFNSTDSGMTSEQTWARMWRAGAQVRYRLHQYVDILGEVGVMRVVANKVQQGALYDENVADVTLYVAGGAMFPITESFALGLKGYLEGHAGSAEENEFMSNDKDVRSGFGGNGTINGKVGIFGEVRF